MLKLKNILKSSYSLELSLSNSFLDAKKKKLKKHFTIRRYTLKAFESSDSIMLSKSFVLKFNMI